MNREFHYYILHFLCTSAGFSDTKAYTISYSSQYVDNNIVEHNVKKAGGVYKSIVTHNYGWIGDWFPKNVYVPFHFLPGDKNEADERKDGMRNDYCVTPGSAYARELVERAFKTNNFYRIGIGLHTFADTWAHRNFTGFNEKWNCVENNLMPDVGHAEVYSAPDKVNNIWYDKRLVNERVDNNERFLLAAREIYKLLCEYNGNTGDDVDFVMQGVEKIIGGHDDKRGPEERIYDCIIAHDIMEYDKFEWLERAVLLSNGYFSSDELRELDTFEWIKDSVLYRSSFLERPVLQPADGFYESDWYLWQEAAKAHLNEARKILKGLI